MTITKEEFHRLAKETVRDWIWNKIVQATGNVSLADEIIMVVNAVSFHDMMLEAYKESGIETDNVWRNTAIGVSPEIYNELKRMV